MNNFEFLAKLPGIFQIGPCQKYGCEVNICITGSATLLGISDFVFLLITYGDPRNLVEGSVRAKPSALWPLADQSQLSRLVCACVRWELGVSLITHSSCLRWQRWLPLSLLPSDRLGPCKLIFAYDQTWSLKQLPNTIGDLTSYSCCLLRPGANYLAYTLSSFHPAQRNAQR